MDTVMGIPPRAGISKTGREKTMAINSHKWIRNLLLAEASVLLAYSSLCSAQQVSPAISSNLEQTAGTTSTRRSLTSTGGPAALPDDFAKLRLGTGYQLEFEVFGASEMNSLLTVDDDGNVIVPLIGAVHVAGDTLREAEKSIAHELVAKEIINSPTVHLKISAFAAGSVTVSGEVQSPGKVQLLAPRSLLSVLAEAGGETTAAGGHVEIHRSLPGATEQVVEVSYAPGKDPREAEKTLVLPGDTVYIPRAGVIYVLGSVNRPGGYLMVNGGTLSLPQAVALAMGISPVGSSKSVIVVRKQDGQIHEYRLRLDEMQRGKVETFALTDGDMVYVPSSKVKSALINSSAVMSAAASAAIVSSMN
jgi:polysaccharide biosynthesis/export protein